MLTVKQFFRRDKTIRQLWPMLYPAEANGRPFTPSTITASNGGFQQNSGRASYRLDGTNDYLQSATLNFVITTTTQPWTIGIWCKSVSKPATGCMLICYTSAGQGSGTFDKGITVNTSGQPSVYNYDGAVKTAYATKDICDGKWHWVVVSYTGSEVITYVDGKLANRAASTSTFNGYATPSLVWSFVNAGAGTSTNYWNGVVGETAMWSRAITHREVYEYWKSANVKRQKRRMVPNKTTATTVTATGATTMAGMTSSGAATASVDAQGSNTHAGTTSSGQATASVAGTGAGTFAAMTGSSTAAASVDGTGSKTLDSMSSAATGSITVSGSTNVTLDGMTASGAGTAAVEGQGARTHEGCSCTGSGSAQVNCTGANSFDGMTSAATAAITVTGTGAVTLADMTCAGVLTYPLFANGASTFDAMALSGAAQVTIIGAGATTFYGTEVARLPQAIDVNNPGKLAGSPGGRLRSTNAGGLAQSNSGALAASQAGKLSASVDGGLSTQ